MYESWYRPPFQDNYATVEIHTRQDDQTSDEKINLSDDGIGRYSGIGARDKLAERAQHFRCRVCRHEHEHTAYRETNTTRHGLAARDTKVEWIIGRRLMILLQGE
jgi:hypothetical protein